MKFLFKYNIDFSKTYLFLIIILKIVEADTIIIAFFACVEDILASTKLSKIKSKHFLKLFIFNLQRGIFKIYSLQK